MKRALVWAGASSLALVIISWAALWLWPGAVPQVGYGRGDRQLLAADGRVMALLADPRVRCGPWVEAGDIPPVLAAAAVAAEDNRFHGHPGVDPLALIRATAQNISAGRIVSGGSTITMQLARLLEPSQRTLGAKLREAVVALWLERHMTKAQIMEQYLNRAPFGGPLVGAGAACRVLLGKAPQRLAPHEAALLMALPQDPARLLKKHNRHRLKARRDMILGRMAASGAMDQSALERNIAAPIVIAESPGLADAPHLARLVKGLVPVEAGHEIKTYIDLDLQRKAADLAAEHCRLGAPLGLRQAAVVVLRNSDRAVLTWVGSADFDGPWSGQVDGVLAKRQPGSTLKPFVYGLALEKGHTLAGLVADEPMGLQTAGGVFRPVDYDGKSRGEVTMRQALGSSLNLPALRLMRDLGVEPVLRRLHGLGLELPRRADHYGLGLALGNGEVTLLELAQSYAALADGGRWAPARLWQGQETAKPRQAADAAACRLIADVLADDEARALGFGHHSLLELPFPAAVKTGTSQHYKDNWCVGFTAKYTVAVWVGNFSAQPMAGVSGITGAGPLWRQVMLLLHARQPGGLPPWPSGVESLAVCCQSGCLAGPDCPNTRLEYFLAGKGPDASCPVHAKDLSVAGRPRVELLAPANGAVYALDPGLPASLQVLACRARAEGKVIEASWLLDGRPLESFADPLKGRLVLEPGDHEVVLRVRGEWGRSEVRAGFHVLAM